MQLKSAKEIWDKIVQSYEGDSQVKCVKLQTLRIQYETLKMHSDESVSSYFLCIDEIVNCMKNMGEEIKEATLVEKIWRSLSSKFESKVCHRRKTRSSNYYCDSTPWNPNCL